jgi:peptide chain release factor 2
MRAETEHMVVEIEKSLALLRQRLGWETAAHRLEEFNPKSEDPDPGTTRPVPRS